MSGSEQMTHASCRCARIRELNDQLRINHRGGRFLITPGVSAMSSTNLLAIFAALKSFSDFDTDNDPYREHDMGAVEIDGASLLWKIDYYDKAVTYGSPDPSDPTVTTRIMTIMLAEEY